MSNTDSLLPLIKIFRKWLSAIIILCGIAVIGAVIVSLMMDNYYKSTTIFYAASADLAKPSPIGGFEVDIDYYGLDQDIDRILSIANSGNLANIIIAEFQLAEHYEIKDDTPKGQYKVYERFNKHFKAQKNKFDAIEISMEDKDREMAMVIANRARDIINEILQELIKNSQDLLISKYETNISEKQVALDSLNQKLQTEKAKFGIYDTQSQGMVLSEILASTKAKTIFIDAKINNFRNNGMNDSLVYYNALKTSFNNQIKAIEKDLSTFNKGISKVTMLEQEQEEFGLQLSLDKERYKQLKSAKGSAFTTLHIVEEAKTPLVKSRPKRSILVIGSGMIALFFSLLMVLIIERFRSVNWKEI